MYAIRFASSQLNQKTMFYMVPFCVLVRMGAKEAATDLQHVFRFLGGS
jgi:hypothetical protein